MRKILKALIPKKARLIFWRYLVSKDFEKEQFILDILFKYNKNLQLKAFIDIGANVGSWTDYAINKFENIYLFECNHDLSNYLNRKYKSKNKVKIFKEALSDRKGVSEFFIPIQNGNIQEARASTIKPQNESFIQQEISLNVLDDYKIENVECIKIDVEGAELAVLMGGIKTIKKHFPLMVIEIEERHNKNTSTQVYNFLSKLGYLCFAIIENKILIIENAKFELIQKKRSANNFIFVHQNNSEISKHLRGITSWNKR